MVDYICTRAPVSDFTTCQMISQGISDHSPLWCKLAFSSRNNPPSTPLAPPTTDFIYQWVEGTHITNYSESWRAWEDHGNNQGFVDRLQSIVDDFDLDPQLGITRVENLLLEEATTLGVVK